MKHIAFDQKGSSGSGYLIHKASLYQALGPEKYRLGDFLQKPATNLEPEIVEAIASGMRQLSEARGFDELTPLEGIGVDGFYSLIEVLHFEVRHQSLIRRIPQGFLDQMEIRHVITGMSVTLYNLILI